MGKLLDGNKKILEFVRFIIVGVIATVIHYSIYCLLWRFFGKELNLAYTLGYGISLFFNFITSNYFTFKTSVSVKRGVKFVIAHCINYLIQIGLLNMYINIGAPSIIAPIFVFMVATPLNFIMVRTALKR